MSNVNKGCIFNICYYYWCFFNLLKKESCCTVLKCLILIFGFQYYRSFYLRTLIKKCWHRMLQSFLNGPNKIAETLSTKVYRNNYSFEHGMV